MYFLVSKLALLNWEAHKIVRFQNHFKNKIFFPEENMHNH